jgi:hypothetical protein
LTTMGYALRLCWEWLDRTEPHRLWRPYHPSRNGLCTPCLMLRSLSRLVVAPRPSIYCLALDVITTVSKWVRSSRLVVDALHENQWIRDITGSLSTTVNHQYVWLWDQLQTLQLCHDVQDKFMWKWSSSQQYSASSAYRAFFCGQCGIPGAKVLSKTKAPPSDKFFIWLMLLDRPWTSDHLHRHRMQNNGDCALYSQAAESISHLLQFCAYSREVWFRLLRPAGFPQLTLQDEMEFADLWLTRCKMVHRDHRKGFDSLVVLISWLVWKQRNDRIFNNSMLHAAQLALWIKEEGLLWVAAGYSPLSDFLQ